MPVSTRVASLVEHFKRNLDAYRSGAYNETQVRREFIDPLLKSLGWDIDNEQGYAEAYKDVVHEDAIKVGGATKAPDYCFRIGGARKFFLEAKKPSVDIRGDEHPAYQLRRYAWSAKLPLSILTDFEELAVYDCRVRPVKGDKASTARTLYFKYGEYADRWDEIAGVFSRDAVLKGSFDKYAESRKAKRGTAEVDATFLKEIEAWRDKLARNIALRNLGLSQRELNHAVQRTVDRLIFLRISEDRGVEDYGQLQALLNGQDTYERLTYLFRRADDRYNSGLFHFKEEQGRPDPDRFTLKLTVDDKILKEIIRGLYYPDSPYEFSVLPADILGQVYEQFLGKVIRLTKGHRAVVEDKPEVKKAGGVYYTPTYVVEYIVRNTVGKLLEGKKPTDVDGSKKGAQPLRVLDPACGSGSFLIGAYQYLLDWHLDWYTHHSPARHAKGRSPKIYETTAWEGQVPPWPDADESRGGGEGQVPPWPSSEKPPGRRGSRPSRTWRLTTAERKRILLTHIYGVDIDPQAVEVTKLSLLLKVLEGENAETLGANLALFHERALPDLSGNIKCGNSLIGPDFYDHHQLDAFDDEARYRINAFDWHTEFPQVFRGKRPGFHAVIGNPPYVDIKGLPDVDVRYLFRRYEFANNRVNLFASFIEKAMALVCPTTFRFSMIVPTALLSQDSYRALRTWVNDNCYIASLARLPNESFGATAGDVKVDTVILVLGPRGHPNERTEIVSYAGYDRITAIDAETAHIHGHVAQDRWSATEDCVWSLNVTDEHEGILQKCESGAVPLESCVKFSLGLTPYDKHKGHTQSLIKSRAFHATEQRDDSFRRLLAGNDVRRYLVQWNGQHWISYGPWLGAARAPEFFTQPRILVKQIIDWTSSRIWAALTDEELYNTQNAFNLIRNSQYSLEYVLGILNSRLITFYHRKRYLDEFKMRFQKILIKDCKRFPIRPIDFSDGADKARHDKVAALVEQMLALHRQLAAAKSDHDKTVLQRQIDATDHQIDRLVYDLYDLTDEEIAIVEESVK